MKMDVVACSKNDEWYTPAYAITPILKYVADKKVIWTPFDTEKSLFVKMMRDKGHRVIHTHIQDGKDFLTMEAPECDAIVSNPPYSKKTEILERLYEINKPFAMLISIPGLFESQRRFTLFRDNPFEIMYMNKCISYFKSYNDEKPSLNPPFSSVYVCRDILPKQIVFEEIDKKESKHK